MADDTMEPADESPPDEGTPAPAQAADDPEQLRVQIAELRAQNAALAGAAPSGGHHPGDLARSIVAVVLVVLGAVFITASVPAIWARNLVLNTDRYVETLKPLATDPGVQAAVVKAVDQQFAAHVNIGSIVRQALPGRAGSLLVSPLTGAANGLVNTVATKFVQSKAFVTLWVDINRAAHTSLVAILTGKHPQSNAVAVDNGVLTLNLAPVITTVKAKLVQAGLTVASNVPVTGATIKIAEVKGLTEAQSAVRLLNDAAWWLPLLALVCFAGAIVAAHHRRRMLVWSALSSAIGMLVIAIGLLVGRHIYLSDLPLHYLTANDASRIFDTFVRFLRDGLRAVFVVALLICLGVWVSGSSRQARTVRQATTKGAHALTGRLPDSPFVRVVSANHGVITAALVGLATLIVVLWTNPSAVLVVAIALITAVLVLIVYSVKPTASDESPAR